jgi:copper chaperone
MHRFKVEKMGCGGCAKAVTRAVHAVEPNARIEVDLGSKLVTVTGAGAKPDRIVQAMIEAGYPAGAA